MRGLLILANVITDMINFSDLVLKLFTYWTLGLILISDRGTQAPRLRITIKNTTGVTSQCKLPGSACCQTQNPETSTGNPLSAVDIATHPWQTRNNTSGEEEFGEKKFKTGCCHWKTQFLAGQ